MSVIVVGSNMPALLAVHAAAVAGYDVTFVADPRADWTLEGPQVLAAPIPLPDRTFIRQSLIRVVQEDEHDDARMPVEHWSKRITGGKGKIDLPEHDLNARLVWDAHAVHEWLVDTYSRYAVEEPIDGKLVAQIVERGLTTILAVAPDTVCVDEGHTYQVHRAVARPVSQLAYDAITFNSNPDYPSSIQYRLFDQRWTVYGPDHIPPVGSQNLQRIIWPAGSTCDCWKHVEKVGVMGRWDASTKLHSAFYDTVHYLEHR